MIKLQIDMMSREGEGRRKCHDARSLGGLVFVVAVM